MWSKIREKVSIQFAKKPGQVIFAGLVILNLALIVIFSGLIFILFHEKIMADGFGATLFDVITLILDAGNIADLVTEKSGLLLVLIYLLIVLVGMVTFTGAVIGYLTNTISDLFDSARSGARRLHVSDHTVIINWNNRASEIINELLYSDTDERVVVLVDDGREEVEREINDRLSDTKERDKRKARDAAEELIAKGKLPKSMKHKYIKSQLQYAKLTVVVRQGETYSLKQLNDISLLNAKSVIILSKDDRSDICKYDYEEKLKKNEKGNINTVKTLIQVSEITSSKDSRDNQKVVVEVEDEWTMALVQKIIAQKQKDGKCNIVPISINRILGQILSQFSIMPELNTVYSELFSNSGLTFYSMKVPEDTNEIALINQHLSTRCETLPVAVMDFDGHKEFYYIANREKDINIKSNIPENAPDFNILSEYSFERKHIAILGHNSKSMDIMRGFVSFINEWDINHELVDILIIDERKYLEKVNYYKDFEGIISMRTIEADIYDKEIIVDTLSDYIDSNFEDTSILILSDDRVAEEDIDANSLTYLIYVQDIISEKLKLSKEGKLERFDVNTIDVIVELLNPKNYDVARSYSVDNVIISNRYISKMIVQLGAKEEIFSFYDDILSYDELEEQSDYNSREMYIKVAERFFSRDTSFPIKATASELIRGIYQASPDDNKSVLLGISKNGKNRLFLNDTKEEITVEATDKLILFSPH